MHGAEIRRVIVDANMLEHADRGDLVELTVNRGIVREFDCYAVREPESRHLVANIGEVFFR